MKGTSDYLLTGVLHYGINPSLFVYVKLMPEDEVYVSLVSVSGHHEVSSCRCKLKDLGQYLADHRNW